MNLSEGLALVTDGSANWKDQSGGWAWIALDAFEDMHRSAGYYPNTTNNQMELYAPTMGLNFLHDAYGPCDVLVYSDSEYVVRGAMDKTRKRNSNRNFWNWLDDAMRVHDYVEFIHIKGHAGHIYNEMADQMAGQARKSKGDK